MVTTVSKEPRGVLWHVSTWLQAIAVIYVAAFAVVLIGAAIALMVRGGVELVSWIGGLTR